MLRRTGFLLLALVISASTWGCAAITRLDQTEPNIPYEGPYPECFEVIKKSNAVLAIELLKLPEIQDGISANEASTLKRLVDIYNTCPDEFDKAFDQMYGVGRPDVRKFCTPLQSTFWLVEDATWDGKECNLLSDFDLAILLTVSWDYNHSQRWKDFSEVTERLNSPELIDYYERTRIHYDYQPGHGEDFKEVRYVFWNSKGHCAQITAFTKHVLRKAGYKAWKRIIPDSRYASPKGNYHRVCVFEANGKKFIMDNGRPRPFGIIPYDQYNIGRHPYGLEKAFEEVWDDLQKREEKE